MSRHRGHSLSSIECVSDSNTSNSASSYEDLLIAESSAADSVAGVGGGGGGGPPEAHWLHAAGLGGLLSDADDHRGQRSDREFIKSLGLNKKQYNTIRKRIDDLHVRVSRQLQQSNINYASSSQCSSLAKSSSNCNGAKYAKHSQPRAVSSTRPDCRTIFSHDHAGQRSASLSRTEYLVQVSAFVNRN